MEKKFKIVASVIMIQWNDNPNLQICWNDMPKGLDQDFQDWLSTVEYERNEAEAG